MKVVINECHGGFGLSTLAFTKLIEKGWKTTTFNEEGNFEDPNADIVVAKGSLWGDYGFVQYSNSQSIRSHPDVIHVVEQLGKEANGRFAELKIVEIPDDIEWEIEEYDGIESVVEKHRRWY